MANWVVSLIKAMFKRRKKDDMRQIKQIAVTEIMDDHPGSEKIRQNIYALCNDGTLWRACTVDGVKMGWDWIEGPPEGRPDKKEPTLEEQAENLGSQTFVGRGHHLHGKD